MRNLHFLTKFEKSETRSGKPIEGTVILPNPSVFFFVFDFLTHFTAVAAERKMSTKTHFGRERINFRAGKCIHKLANYNGLMMILYDLVKMTSISNII